MQLEPSSIDLNEDMAMIEFGSFLLELPGVILFTDAASGLLHWLEDSYGREHWPVTGALITKPNVLHHHQPTYFTKHGWFYSARELFGLGALILAVAYITDLLTWHVLAVMVLGVNANELHKWAHKNKADRPKVVYWLQKTGILQTPVHHAKHHMKNKDTNYCILTNIVNPLLDGLGVWRALEALAFLLFGIKKRPDTSVRNIK